MSDDRGLYLTAKEATEELGISTQTLYAYVSRKGLRSIKVEGSRSRLYWASDISRIKAQRDAGMSGEVASAITLLTEDSIYYRGVDLRELANSASIEEVAALLWNSSPGGSKPPIELPSYFGDIQNYLDNMDRIDRATAYLPVIGSLNPTAFELSPDNYARTGSLVVRTLVYLLFGTDINDSRPIEAIIGSKIGCSLAEIDLVRQLLVLSADHEIDHVTHAVRASASTGTNPFDLIAVALLTGRGVRIRRLRIEDTSLFVQSIVTTDNVRGLINRYIQDGKGLPGFNYALHAKRDPRADALLESMKNLYRDDERLNKVLQVLDIAKEQGIGEPDFILFAMFLNAIIGNGRDTLPIMIVGRAVGWIAHGIEQYHGTSFIRKRANYVGNLPQD